jgi:glycosyltransferase involved in cell wall biosynthesis
MNKREILCIVTGGAGDGARARRLLQAVNHIDITYYDIDSSRSRLESSRNIWELLSSNCWDLVFQEGTGIAGGVNLIRSAVCHNQSYVISSGDPVGGYFRTTRGRFIGTAFEIYERILYRYCSGFIGWTPYLTGMALKMGARRAITIEGAVDMSEFIPFSKKRRRTLKQNYGIPSDHLVCGVIGSLNWSENQSYCYGLELVEMLRYLNRSDVSVLIVGDGSGRSKLEKRIQDSHRDRVIFTGRLPRSEVVEALNAMDIGFITQTVDGLGSYRLTTKLPEYLATGVPVAMSPIPGFYDYVLNAGWALPDEHPTDPVFHRQTAAWLDNLSKDEVDQQASNARTAATKFFDYDVVAPRFSKFINQLLCQS